LSNKLDELEAEEDAENGYTARFGKPDYTAGKKQT
jgi:hypothetical protein